MVMRTASSKFLGFSLIQFSIPVQRMSSWGEAECLCFVPVVSDWEHRDGEQAGSYFKGPVANRVLQAYPTGGWFVNGLNQMAGMEPEKQRLLR